MFAAIALWVAETIGGAVLSEKVKRQLYGDKDAKLERLSRNVEDTLADHRFAIAKTAELLTQKEALERQLQRLQVESAELQLENYRLRRGARASPEGDDGRPPAA